MIRFLREWTLPLAMAIGIAGYFIYTAIPALDSTHAWVLRTVEAVQPVLIFLMLFITFCKVKMRELRWSRWHAYALLMQVSLFALSALLAYKCSMFNAQCSILNVQCLTGFVLYPQR